MAWKAGKRKSGPKPQPGVRTPSGQKSRAKGAVEAEHAEPVARRAQLFGLSWREALDPRAGSALGRLALLGARTPPHPDGISEAQYRAGLMYRHVYEVFRQAVLSPGREHLGGGAGSGGEGVSEDYADWAEAAILDWEDAVLAVKEAEQARAHRGRPLLKVLDQVVLNDRELIHRAEDLSVALWVLDWVFGGAAGLTGPADSEQVAHELVGSPPCG